MQLQEISRFTDRVAETAEFYETLLDAEPLFEDESVAMLDADGLTLLIHERYEPDDGELPAEDHVGFGVAALDDRVKELAAAGLEVEREPTDYDWGRSAFLRDPAGNLIELKESR